MDQIYNSTKYLVTSYETLCVPNKMEISMFSHQMTRPQCPHRRRRLEKSFPLILGRPHSSRRRRRRRKGDLEYLPSSKFAAVLTAGRIMSVCLPSKSQKSPKQPLRLLSCLFRLRPLQGCRYLISVHYLSRKYWGNLCWGKEKKGCGANTSGLANGQQPETKKTSQE